MKAIVQEKYGPAAKVLHLDEIPQPAVGDGDVLIRVRAAGVNPLDWHFVTGKPLVGRAGMGLPAPKLKVRGVDVAGRVEAMGKDVKTLAAGDEVFGWCDGSFAEFAAAPEGNFVKTPSGVTPEQAAAVPVAAITALQALRNFGGLKAGQRVLINGASGGVGSYGVQIAKSMGANVTGVCSTRNLDLVRSLGAERVVDYTHEDFTVSGDRYDLIFDNAGSQPIARLRRTLAPDGVLVYNSGAVIRRFMAAILLSRLSRNVRTFLANMNHDDLLELRGLMESGNLRTVIDCVYPLDQAAAAIAYVEAGHARGKVVITV